MRILGIVGGIAPESTIEYYRLIVAAYRRRRPDGSFPPVIINSIDLKKLLDLAGAEDLAGLTDYLLDEVSRLERAGAELGLLASNTPHIVFDELQSKSPIPLISIVETAAREAKVLGWTKVGLFGTRFTMRGDFYPAAFSREGITVVLPDDTDLDFIHEKYVTELIAGVYLPETRQKLLSIVERMTQKTGIQGLILGGTELPLLLKGERGAVPFLDTSRIHAERAVTEMLAG